MSDEVGVMATYWDPTACSFRPLESRLTPSANLTWPIK